MVNLLFTKAQACVSINERLAQMFEIKQGFRQGCLVLLYLFSFIGEILNGCNKMEVPLTVSKELFYLGLKSNMSLVNMQIICL